MRLLLSNDDGYQAPGLSCLAAALAEIGEVTVVAPDRDRSGASNSLTLDRPLRAIPADNGFVYVDGTPTDCVHLAITGLLEHEPDVVVSGINRGGNLGDDVIYSGTVAAAMEGRFLGLPAIAVSLAAFDKGAHYASAAQVTVQLIRALNATTLPSSTILNVNVPDLPPASIKGLQSTRLGHRHRAKPVVKSSDPRGREIYWIGEVGPEDDAGPGTDFYAVNTGFVSITPLHVDLTRHDTSTAVADWLSAI